MADEPNKQVVQGEGDDGAGTPAPKEPEPKAKAKEPEPNGEPLVDKHNEPAINRGRYERDMKAKDDEIAELRRQLEQASGEADKGADALKEIEKLKAQLADEKLDHSLEVAGCVNAKAAKAILADYDGDVAAMKEACPYLFRTIQTGSTGARQQHAPNPTDELIAKAREAAGTTYLYAQ